MYVYPAMHDSSFIIQSPGFALLYCQISVQLFEMYTTNRHQYVLRDISTPPPPHTKAILYI